MGRYILAPTTSAGNSKTFAVSNKIAESISVPLYGMPCHVTAPGLAGSETVKIQKQNAEGTFNDYYINNELIELKAGANSGRTIYAPGVYRAVKSATAASVGVELSTEAYP